MPVGAAPARSLPASASRCEQRVVALGAAACLAGVVSVLALRRLGDFDLPWHLALGRTIAELRSIPATDPLAFTNRPIEYLEVVADLLLWVVYRAGGSLGLQLFGAAVVGGVSVALFVRGGAREPASPLAVSLALAAMNPWLIVRPALLSFLLLALLLLLLDRHRLATTPAKARATLALVVPLGLLWANVHGFVVVGLLVLWLYAFYRGACRLARGRAGVLLPVRDGTDVGMTLALVAAGTLAMMLNPGGPRFLLGPLRVAHDFGAVTEWATTDLTFLTRTEPMSGVLLLVALSALALGRDPETGRRVPTLYEISLFLLALALGRSAVRLIPLAAVIVAPFIAQRFATRMPSSVGARGAGVLLSLLVVPYLLWQTATSLGVGFDQRNVPELAVRWVEQNGPAGRMWNFSPYGGYLSLRLYPKYKVLIDGRTSWVHDPALTERVVASEWDVEELRSLVREFELEWAVSRAIEGETFGAALARAPEFAMTHLDDVSAVYVRRDGPNALLAARGYRVLRHLISPGEVLVLAVRGGPRAADLAYDGALAAAQDPASARAAFFDACGQLAIRDRARFDRAVEALQQLAPGNPALEALRSAWLMATGP
jgi:hypothetical protein